jgi:hypothetical protein
MIRDWENSFTTGHNQYTQELEHTNSTENLVASVTTEIRTRIF